jgi:methylamine dehydrogenase heavy chain
MRTLKDGRGRRNQVLVSVLCIFVMRGALALTYTSPRLAYAGNCAGCHLFSGAGIPNQVPRLRGFVGYFMHTAAGRAYVARAPDVENSPLSSEKLADLLNWMLRRYSAAQLPVDFRPYTAAEVAALRTHPMLDVAVERKRALRLASSQQTTIPDAAHVVTLAPPKAHWVYIVDPSPSLVVTNVMVVDGDSGAYLGTITSGYLANFLMTPDGQTIYTSATYYSRAVRGTRTDVITSYDPRTLAPLKEKVLANGRFLSPGKKYALSLSTDGRYLFSANLRPATSVSIVDLPRLTFVKEIDTPGCALAYPTGAASFASICGNGVLMNVSIASNGVVSKSLTSRFFDPDTDPVFDAPAIVHGAGTFYFVSYGGRIFPVERAHGQAIPQPSWSFISKALRKANWRTGGYYQLLALDPQLGRLYVLMHQGGQWSQKDSGTEVWVIDTRTHRVVARDPLVRPADAIAVTLDKSPLLFAIKDGTLEVYRIEGDALTHLREVPSVGTEASFLSVPGEG